MSRRRAQVTQADIARVLRAAKQVGAKRVLVPVGDKTVVVELSTMSDKPIADPDEVIL
jgi:hypothetical protein